MCFQKKASAEAFYYLSDLFLKNYNSSEWAISHNILCYQQLSIALFLKNYNSSEGAISHNILCYQQLSIAR